MGTAGLITMARNVRNQGKVVVGMVYAAFSYIGIEALVYVINGGAM